MDFIYGHHFLKCVKCEREVLAEIPQFGVSHIVEIILTCKNCLVEKEIVNNKDFKADNPKAYKEILEWLKK